MKLNNIGVVIFCLFIFMACNNKKTDATTSDNSDKAQVKSGSGNYLTMKINGEEWKANDEILGAFHPKGYNNALLISGTKNTGDKYDQNFNINLYNTSGPAIFDIKTGNADLNVAQLANVSKENYLYGSMLGFDMKIAVTKASNNPTIIEAIFSGELKGNAGDKLTITEGKFYYHE